MFGSALDIQQDSPIMKAIIFTVLVGLSLAEFQQQLFPFQQGSTLPLLFNPHSGGNHLPVDGKPIELILHSTPDLSHYGKLEYPKQSLIDLGEIVYSKHTPEVIQIEKKVEVKVPKPFPVQVPHKIPVPVAFKVPHIIKVPQVITVAQPVPVEVVKEVPVPHHHNEPGYQYSGSQFQNNGGYQTQEQTSENGHQSDWKGLTSSQYNIPSTNYGVPFPSSSYTLPGSSYGEQNYQFGNNAYGYEQGQYASGHAGYLDPRTAGTNFGYGIQNEASGAEHHNGNEAYASEQNYQVAQAETTEKSN